ncbi:hypothetical protein EDB92DRAFT_1816503 [Lactarius akahatsu]|uniref:Uncharacterized protein n=1 Tax=Lactarius akahatsu TaxID=416441 RepID=A0AAD4Q7U6_9AGAM|nr:hypothetical protein EDB92DRAFT_1816503 [Lactarius akahatsu]
MRNLHDRLPSTQARRADDLLNEATELLEQHREVTSEEDYIMARALLTSARDFRHGLEGKSVIRRSQQSRLYLDKAHETLETVKQVTLEGVIKIWSADASAVLTDHEHMVTVTETNTDSDAISNYTLSLGTTTPAGAFTAASLASSAPIRGPTLQVALAHVRPLPSFGLLTPPDDQFPQEHAAPYNEIALVSTTVVKETRPSVNPVIIVSPLPTPPLTPETPAKPSPANSTHVVSPAGAPNFSEAYRP